MERHINILGVLYIVWGALGLVVGLGVFMLLSLIGAVSGDQTALFVLTIVGVGIALLFLITSIPEIIAGIFLMKRKEWARILMIILAFFNLLNIPLGTILGAYTIWALLNSDMVRLFQTPVVPRAPVQAPPSPSAM